MLLPLKEQLSDVPIDMPAPTEDPSSEPTKEWVQLAGTVLTGVDKELTFPGEKLNDLHFNMAQGLLKG